jgi:competence protein ComEA
MAGNIDPRGSDKVDINRASKDDLKKVKGINDTLAEKIVEYRDQNGEFHNKEDLKKVEGISEQRASELEQAVRFD